MTDTASSVSKADIRSAFHLMVAVCETLQEVGQAPAGYVYSALAPHLDLPAFNRMIDLLCRERLVERAQHLLRWIGPKNEQPSRIGETAGTAI